ncbi:MAG TPA: cupin domain-containing protein, partial [Bradyrhizobium sp.]
MSATERDSEDADIAGPRNAERATKSLHDPSTGFRPRHHAEPEVVFRGQPYPDRGGRLGPRDDGPRAADLQGHGRGLKAGAVRELHWHKEAEWSYMLKGKARITAVNEAGRTFADDVGEGDLW